MLSTWRRWWRVAMVADGASTSISVLWPLQHLGGHDLWWPCFGQGLDQMEVTSNPYPCTFKKVRVLLLSVESAVVRNWLS